MKLLMLSLVLSFLPISSLSASTIEQKTIFMTVWRGCEEACQGFKDYIENNEYPVNIVIRDAERDKSKLDGFLTEATTSSPDLVVTWGTSVSKAIIGTIDDYGSETKLGDIPVLFMIVADPVGANIIDSGGSSGRPLVAGIRNRIDEEVQIRAVREYFDVTKVGVIYSEAELNSVLNTNKLKLLSEKMDFETIVETYELDESGKPLPDQFESKMKILSQKGVDVVYVGSSSYNLSNRDKFTSAALKYGLPVASAYDSMVTESSALISVSNKYYRVGQLAANQAVKILFEEMTPGDLPIAELSSYSMSINMDVAKKLSLYPPIQLLRFAELVNTKTE